MCKNDQIFRKLSVLFVTVMRAKPSHHLPYLVAAVELSPSAVVWTDPGCIDLLTAHGQRLVLPVVKWLAHKQWISSLQACQLEQGLDTSRCCIWCMWMHIWVELEGQHLTSYSQPATVKGLERKTKHNLHKVDSDGIELQGRGPSESGLSGCQWRVPERRIRV